MEKKSFPSLKYLLLYVAILSSVTRTCIGTNETLSSVPPDSNNTVSPLPTTTMASTTTPGSLNTTIPTESSANVSTISTTTVSPQSTESDLSSTQTTITSLSNETTSIASVPVSSSNTTESQTNTTESTTSTSVDTSTSNSLTTSTSTLSPTSTTFSTTSSIQPSTSIESTTTSASKIPSETDYLVNVDPYSNARSAGLSSFFALIILIGLSGYGLWHFRKHQMKEIFCGPSFRQFGSLTLQPSDSSLPQRSTRSFRFAMGPTNNSTFDIRAGDELQRRDNSDTGFGQPNSRSRSFENFDPFDPRSHDYESEGQFVNRNDGVMLS